MISLPNLLQNARNSLTQKRTLNLQFVICELYSREISFEDFFNLQVPKEFLQSVKFRKEIYTNRLTCYAPWCKNYGGPLRKTGTSYKKTTTEIYKYYLMCIDCGCQYALNLSKELIERTNFISIYFYLRNILSKDISIKAAHINSGFTVDELKRAIAYFDSRGIFRFENYHIDTIREILNDFVRALQAGEKIKDIEKWARWNSQYEFLFYRYHNEVLQFESSRNLYEQPKNVIPNINKLQTTILPILESMLYNNKIITIGNVCKAAGICPETLRLWGGCPYVSDMKERQYKKRIDEDINKLYMDIKTYLEMNIFSEVSASSLYNYLGFTRIKLWRVSPELTTFISTQVRNHNQLIHTDFK